MILILMNQLIINPRLDTNVGVAEDGTYPNWNQIPGGPRLEGVLGPPRPDIVDAGFVDRRSVAIAGPPGPVWEPQNVSYYIEVRAIFCSLFIYMK